RESECIGTDFEDMELVRMLWMDQQILKEIHREKRRQLRNIAEQELPRQRLLEQVNRESQWNRCTPEGHELKHSAGNVFFVTNSGGLHVMKIPRDNSQSGKEHFRQEIKTAVALDHPNVIKVVDYN